jgi:hypothetical protein
MELLDFWLIFNGICGFVWYFQCDFWIFVGFSIGFNDIDWISMGFSWDSNHYINIWR